jgi:hypothetical protein
MRLNCGFGGSGAAAFDFTNDEIEALRGSQTRCTADPGPFICTRISCHLGAAIWFCNDTPQRIEEECGLLADYAHEISFECIEYARDHPLTRGQLFDARGWNVVVGQDTTCED